MNVKKTRHIFNEKKLSAIRTSDSCYRDDTLLKVAGHELSVDLIAFRAPSVIFGRVRMHSTTRMRGQTTSAAFETGRSVSLESTGFYDRSTGDVTPL